MCFCWLVIMFWHGVSLSLCPLVFHWQATIMGPVSFFWISFLFFFLKQAASGSLDNSVLCWLHIPFYSVWRAQTGTLYPNVSLKPTALLRHNYQVYFNKNVPICFRLTVHIKEESSSFLSISPLTTPLNPQR